jgi:hypothetical protein
MNVTKLKRTLALTLSLLLVLSSTTAFAASDSATISLNGWSGTEGNYSISGSTVTVNDNNRNNFVVSNTSVKNFVFEADISSKDTVHDNNACFGLAFGIGAQDIADRADSGWPNDFAQLQIKLDDAVTPFDPFVHRRIRHVFRV